ncbi:acyl-CoA synthetase [Patulibacter sp.]|uniref:acyl-CoA synthetase n=1 Tax=Patulibacter sp. TaxID=1912859 RepID=UPI00271E9746|nr:AMP-binding protein [Patulibacter sp.]MDO9407140.1 AMP-binding protein [Patulibacter sp.]
MHQPTTPGRDASPRLQDHAQERRTFRLDVPDVYNPVIAIVESWAAEDPEALAVLSLGPTGEVTAEQSAADLARDARRAARVLLDLGVGPGDRVFVMLPRIAEWYAVVLGAMRIGAVPMPGPNLLTPKDIAYRLEQAGAVAAVTDAAGLAKIDAIDAPLPALRVRLLVRPDASGEADGTAADDNPGAVGGTDVVGGTDRPAGEDPAHWHDLADLVAATAPDGGALPEAPTRRDDPLLTYFTSGTVSHPKMVTHSQEYGLAHVPTARFWHDLRSGDRHWTVTDTGWAKAAWGGLFGQLHERATIVQVALGRPDADTILRILAEHRITSFCAPPTLYRTLVQADLGAYDLSALRHCTSAGEPLNPEVIKVWARGTGGLTVYDAYGQTETSVLVANYRAVPVRPGSMGLPVPGWDVEVLDDEDRRAPDGEVGNIAVRTDGDRRPVGLFHGYDGNPEATAERFRGGWYFTGDKAARDAEGYLWFEGRDDDVITSSAYRIGPFEVESALVEHDAVVEAAVVGKDDPERTQIVTAFVILAAGVEASDALARELQDHVKGLTAPYKYPREIHFVTELPKTVSGKIRRTELRDRLRAQG